jgi:S1-C subfamily serine protease
VEAKAVAASVRILFRPGVPNAYVTGTLVSADGQIATCAHHFALPGDKVIVALSDGRDVPGEVVGLNFPADVSLIRITAPGVYPFVEIGDSWGMRPGDPCLLIGYGPVDRQSRLPVVRRTSIVEPKEGMDSLHLPTKNTVKIVGGDSGGGLFDSSGRLVGFSPESSGLPDAPHEHVRIETLQAQQKDLRVPFERAARSEVMAVDAVLEASANRMRASTVEVLSDGKATALGTIVGADGTVLTKASTLRGSLTCRLADGRTVAASRRTVVREHDLAVLKIEAGDLTALQWADESAVPVGALVGLAGVRTVRGTVSHSAQGIEAKRGILGVTLRDTPQGMEVVELESEDFLPEEEAFQFAPQFLKKGDVILGVNGQPIATRKQLSDLFDPKRPDVPAVAGDWVRLKMRRAGMEIELDFQLRPWGMFPLSGQTARNSGFARVYGVAVEKDPPLFGGAVVNREGRAIGVTVAARHKGWVLVLPVAVITEALAWK